MPWRQCCFYDQSLVRCTCRSAKKCPAGVLLPVSRHNRLQRRRLLSHRPKCTKGRKDALTEALLELDKHDKCVKEMWICGCHLTSRDLAAARAAVAASKEPGGGAMMLPEASLPHRRGAEGGCDAVDKRCKAAQPCSA